VRWTSVDPKSLKPIYLETEEVKRKDTNTKNFGNKKDLLIGQEEIRKSRAGSKESGLLQTPEKK